MFLTHLVTMTTDQIDLLPGSDLNGSAPAVNGDGSVVAFVAFVAFVAYVEGEPYTPRRVFVRDVATGATTQVSTDPGPGLDPPEPRQVAIDAAGRTVVYTSGRLGATPQVFAYDRTAATRRTVLSGGAGGMLLSHDGRYLVFESTDALVAADTNKKVDVYRHDLTANQVERVSLTANRAPGWEESRLQGLNPAGTVVLYATEDHDLLVDDAFHLYGIYMRTYRRATARRRRP